MSTQRTSRRAARATAIVTLVVASVAAAGCGKSDDNVPTILNTEKVERAIEQSVALQRDKTAHVSCPSGVHQKKGLVFNCTAVVKRQSTRFVVTQKDGAGRVHYVAR
jgi:hypothetical protein